MSQINEPFASGTCAIAIAPTPDNNWVSISKPKRLSRPTDAEMPKKNPIVSVFARVSRQSNPSSIDDKSSNLAQTNSNEKQENLAKASDQSVLEKHDSKSVLPNASSQRSYVPAGIVAILDAETKQIIREVLPNSGKNVADTKIMSMIATMKTNGMKLIDYKKRVVMIFHQAIKKDRGPLVNKIIEMWNRSKFPLIELLDSTYDSCKPITQAAWCGSIDCFRVIVANDTTNTVLQTINSKGETLDRTLLLGKSYALSKDPSNAVFIEDRFNECNRYLVSALETQKRHSAGDSKTSISPEQIERDAMHLSTFREIQTFLSELNVASAEMDIMLKIISIYGDNAELAKNYYLQSKDYLVAKMATSDQANDIIKSIDENLSDNGITFA
jgi:hypothetical protein